MNALSKDRPGKSSPPRPQRAPRTPDPSQAKALARANHLSNAALMTRSAMHEIKNDLGPLVGYLSILEFAPQSNTSILAKMQDSIGRVQAQLERISGPVRQSAKHSPRVLCLTSVVQNFLGHTRALGFFRRIQVITQLTRPDAPDQPVIHAPKEVIEQVLFNLLSNAIDALEPKFSSKGSRGTIWIELLVEAAVVKLTVKDSGQGIAQHLTETVFEPYFSTKEESGGGLGLSVTRNLVEALGGSIRLDSVEQAGTLVTLSFPQLSPQAAADLSELAPS